MDTTSTLNLANLIRAEGLECFIHGDDNFSPTRLRSVKHAGTINSVVYYAGNDPADIAHLYKCLLICKPSLKVNIEANGLTLIRTERPKLAFAIIAHRFRQPKPKPSIGNNVIIEEGAVLNRDGIGYVWGLDGKRWMMPQIGGLFIGSNCLIGANSVIMRGALEHTNIGDGTIINPCASVGHGCQIGDYCFVGNSAVLCGGVEIGEYCWIGVGAVINPQVKLGNQVVVGSGAVVTKSFKEDGIIIHGNPAKFIRRHKKGEKLSGMPAYEV